MKHDNRVGYQGKIPPTIVPTDIIRMECNVCGQTYTRGGNGLMFDGKTGEFKPCIGTPAGLEGIIVRDKCGSMDYTVWRQMEVVAMPIGRVFNDLSRKHN